MANEQYRYVINMAINENGVVGQATRIEERISAIFGNMARKQARVGILDESAVTRYGARLHSVLTEAMKIDVRNSPLFQGLSRELQALTRVGGTRSVTETPTSTFMEGRLRLAQAEINNLLRQIPKGDGASDADNSRRERLTALRNEITSSLGIERANKFIEKQKLDYIADFGKATNAEINAQQRAARLAEQAATKEQRQQRAEETARARATLAIEKRAAQENVSLRREEEARARATVAIQKRAQAEETATARLMRSMGQQINTALDRKAAAADADRVSGGFQGSYPGADPATGVGRAQAGINRAERSLELASLNLANERSKESRNAQSLGAAEQRVESATSALGAARAKLAAMEARSAGGGIGSQFMAGFRGQSERPYAEQIGQAFKFSVFYGTAYKLLFAFTATLQQTLQEGIAFQQAVTELKLATQSSSEHASDLAETLGDQSVQAGFAPSEGVLAGARAVGLYGATEAPQIDQDRIAEMSARVASRLAFSSGMQIADVQTNLAAITNAFGGGAAGQFRTYDLDAYMAHRFGVAPGQTIQAVAESGTVGKAAGFSQEGVNAIAALLMGRTGQTAPAVAGYMAQIFSRGGEGVLGGVMGKYGIDQNASLADQIKELARIYKTASEGEKTEIASSFGRGKVQNAMVVLLEQFSDVLDAEKDARTKAGGAGDKAYDARLGNIGGQIQLTMGILKEFANQLSQSGVLEVLGATVLVFREIVEAASSLLRIWNELPGPIRAVIGGMIALAAAQRLGAGAAVVGALPAGAMVGARGGSMFAAAAGTLINPVTAAVGGLLAIGALKGASDRLAAAQNKASDALLESDLTSASSADELRARAAMLGNTAGETRDSAGGVMARIINLGADRQDNLDLASRLEAEKTRLEAVAKLVEANESASTPDNPLIAGFDADSLSSSLETMAASGLTAQQQFDALSASLRGGADAAARAAESFNATLFAGTRAQGAHEAITDSVYLGQSKPGLGNIAKNLFTYTGTGPLIDDRKYENIAPELIEEALSQGDVQKRMQEAMSSITSLEGLTPKKAREIATTIIGDTAEVAFADQGLPASEIEGAQTLMIQGLTKYLLGEAQEVKDIVRGNKQLNDTEVMSAIATIQSTTASIVDALPETDYKGRIQAQRAAVREIMQSIRKSDDGAPAGAFEQLDVARRALAQSQFNELEAARRAAQQSAKGKRQIAAVGQRFLRREIRAAIRGGDQDLLAEIIGQAGEGAIALARKMLQDAAAAARAAQAIRAKALRLEAAARAALSGAVPGTVFEKKDPGNYDGMISALETAVHADKGGDVYTTGSDVPGLGGTGADAGAAAEPKETAAERRAALMAARAVRSESAIASARAEMASARAAMATAKKGTVEYYSALSSYYSARNALTDAILEYRSNKMLLGIDITDPLAQARVAMRVARQKLASDRGKGPDVRAADRVALQQAQADLESTRFQQRLQSVQTADELGRISHQKYISYLEHEHDRLERIKHRTFQQQEQLDQIDGLLKEAASAMDAQWNFGDIKLPTPYQVRRYVEETSPTRYTGGNDRPSTQNATIYIDGADTGAVKRIIDQYVGRHGRVLTTQPRRK